MTVIFLRPNSLVFELVLVLANSREIARAFVKESEGAVWAF